MEATVIDSPFLEESVLNLDDDTEPSTPGSSFYPSDESRSPTSNLEDILNKYDSASINVGLDLQECGNLDVFLANIEMSADSPALQPLPPVDDLEEEPEFQDLSITSAPAPVPLVANPGRGRRKQIISCRHEVEPQSQKESIPKKKKDGKIPLYAHDLDPEDLSVQTQRIRKAKKSKIYHLTKNNKAKMYDALMRDREWERKIKQHPLYQELINQSQFNF